MDWACDGLGRPSLAGIHDARLARLTLDAEAGTLELRLKGVGGERLRLVYRGVEMLGGDGLWEAAIVNTLFVWRVSAVPPAFLDDPSAGWRHLLTGRAMEPEGRVEERSRLSAKLAHGALSTMVCSYGGDLSVLASSLHVDEWQ